MEAKVEAVQKNVTSNSKELLLPEKSCLKNFIIPKRIPDKDLLTECSADQRDYSDVKQRLNQSCFDIEYNLESLWHFDKIEMVYNKDLEEDFVAKRAKLREEGKQDKELSNFLVVSKDEVLKICKSGLRTSYNTKKELDIMKELGNPQLGVYLFRYVDIALNYASKYSVRIENIIIFRVLLGKVKYVQPPKGKKKVALDPTPNSDCHMSRIPPSLKDSVEDQSIGSLIYFYEYNGFSKPVEKPRQCLPYAVVKVKCINRKMVIEYPFASLKCRPKLKPMGRILPLENCTRVTRIGENKLVYEHFRKPEEIFKEFSYKASVDVSSFSACDGRSSTVITSRQIKDPRLKKREENLGKQDGEIEYYPKIPTSLGLPYPVPDKFFIHSSEHALSHSQFMEKESWKERTLEESPTLLNKGKDYSVNGEQGLGNVNQLNREILASCNTHIDHALKTNVSLKLEGYGNKDSNRISAGNLKREGTKHSKLLSSLLNPFKTLGNGWKSQESEPVCITMHKKKQEHFLELPFCVDTNRNICNQNPECVTPGKDKIDNRDKMGIQLQNSDDCTSEMYCATEDDTSYARKNCSSLEREHNSHNENGRVWDCILETVFHRRNNMLKETWNEDICEWPLGYQMSEEKCEKQRTQAVLKNEKSSMTEIPKQNSKLVYSTSERTNITDEREEYMINKVDDSSFKENISDIDIMYSSHTACKTDIEMKDLDEKYMRLCKPVSLDNVFRDNKESPLLLNKCIDRQRNLEIDGIIDTCGFDRTHTWQLEEGSHFEEKSTRHTHEIQKLSATENAAGQENSANRNLVKSVGDRKKLLETSDKSDILDLESSFSGFCLNFQEPCLLTEPQLRKTENDKEQLRNISDQTSLTKCTDLSMYQRKSTAFLLDNSITVPRGNVKQIEIKKSESENTCSSEINFIPKILEQHFETIYNAIPDLKVLSETEIAASKANKKCPSVPLKSYNENMSGEQAMYVYLHERMDWGSTSGKPTQNTKALGSHLRKENKRGSLNGRKTEKETELFNTLIWPDLRITITNISDKLINYLPERKQDAIYSKNQILQPEYCCSNNEIAEWKLYTAENGKYKQVAKNVEQLENNADRLSSGDYQQSHRALDDGVVLSYNHLLQEPERKEEEAKKDFSGLEPYVIKNIPVKPLVEVALDLKDMTPGKDSTCRQITLKDTNEVVRLQSPLTIVSEQGIGSFIATDILPHLLPNNANKNESRLNEKCLSNEYPVDSEDVQLTEIGDKYLDFISKISGILQKADETSSLNILDKQVIVCRNVLPIVIKAFEKKQGCSFDQVLVYREIVGNAEKNMWAGHKLKPCAIESLIELQIIMEIIEFIENKKRFLEGELTFRSLLWYDDSLFSELFGGQSGYQQQSNFFPAFQRRLKYSAFDELQSYHKQLVEVFENTRWQDHSYYSYLKSRREIVECEAALKNSSHFSDFFLSVPYVCGANYGDTLEDLENARKSTVDLINTCKSLPDIAFGAEKDDHLWIIMEIIATKIEFIKTCEEVNMKASLFGLEHIFFDAAKSLTWRERDKFINEDAKEQNLKINEAALSKFYGSYEHMIKKLGGGNLCSAPEENILRNSSEESHNCETRGLQQEANNYIRNSLVFHLDISYISEILDEAQCADVNRLQQLVCRCTEHLEILEKDLKILLEENVSNVLITKENVLGFMTSAGINAVILKPETVEVYTEMAMIYETVSFLKNLIARKVDKPRFRSLLWFDESLLPELFRCQEKIASFSYRKDNFLKVIESSIAELQAELNVVCDYAETLNCSYAVHLLTRELRELSETRKLLETSKSSISMCVDFVPYTISLNYGSTVSELECNYNQFSLLLEKLMLADTKDLGKMAHIMKIMKTIEHMKFVCTELGKSPLPVVIYQMLRNWRKSCELKKQDLKTDLGTNERLSTKHSIYVSGPQGLKTAVGSRAQQKRPASITSEDDPSAYEEKNDSFHSKKKKVVASLMTTTKKIHEKEKSRNQRKSAKYNSLKGKELPLNISAGNTWSSKGDGLTEESPISPSCSKQLKVVYPLERIQYSPKASESNFVHSNLLQNIAYLKGFSNSSRNYQHVNQNNKKCFTSYDEKSKDAYISSTKFWLPLGIAEDSATSVAKLGGNRLVPAPLNEHCDLKPDVPGNTLEKVPDCNTGISLTSEHDKIGKESAKTSIMPSWAPTNYSDSSAVTELNGMEEPLCTKSSSNENIRNSVDCSVFSENENVEETSQKQNYMYTHRTIYPYSWYFYQTGSNNHSVTQMCQEVNSYETCQWSSGITATTNTVCNAQSSMFYSQILSQFSVVESQRHNFVQYPICGYFSSSVPFLYSYQQPPSCYSQAAFPYPYNTDM